MGLVEADARESAHHHSFQVEGVNILWDDAIEEVRASYGRLFIDAFKSFRGEQFHVEFEGAGC